MAPHMNATTRSTKRGLEFLDKGGGIVSVSPCESLQAPACVGAADRATEQMLGCPGFVGGLPIGFMACCYIERNIEQRLGTSHGLQFRKSVGFYKNQ
jgi:hypothetical protein